MKFEISVLSMVLMFRVCCYGAVPNSNYGHNNTSVAGAAATTTATATATATAAATAVRASNSSKPSADDDDDNDGGNPIRNMIGCLREDSVFKCFNDRVGTLIKVWRETLLNSVRRNGDQPLQVNQGLEKTIRDFGKAVYRGVSNFFGNFSLEEQEEDVDDDESRSNEEGTGPTDPHSGTALEERGHKKKKKVHREIKKIVIKIIIAIALFILKIKAILGMIQSLVITKLLVTALIYVATLTFKIWYEIKQSKLHHHEKPIIYYDNEHHDHTYDLPQHAEYDEHSAPSSWGSLWGRSYAPTPATAVTSSAAFQSMFRKPWPYYAKAKPPGAVGSDEEEYS